MLVAMSFRNINPEFSIALFPVDEINVKFGRVRAGFQVNTL